MLLDSLVISLATLLYTLSSVRALPDFAPSSSYLASSIFLDTLHRIDPCLIEEGSITGSEVPRRIVRFGSLMSNVGPDDFVLGAPPKNRTGVIPPYFQWSTCHGHWHFLGYAQYALVEYMDPTLRPATESLTVVARGHKMGFCLEDLLCGPGANPKFTCQYQGITSQCGDIYNAMLDGQWIDLTGVTIDPAKRYSIAIMANPSRNLNEVTFANNNALATVDFGTLPGYNTWGTALGSSAASLPEEYSPEGTMPAPTAGTMPAPAAGEVPAPATGGVPAGVAAAPVA